VIGFCWEEEMKKENRLVSTDSKSNLVLGLNRDGKIVQFDQGCQRLTGYTRNEALNKKIGDFLIPTAYITKWEELFDAAIKNEDIADFEIPLKTSDGEEVLISWSSLPIENKERTVRNICFIGKNIENKQYKKITETMKQDNNKNMILHVQAGNKLVDNKMDDFEKRISTHPNKLNEIIKDRSKKHKKFNKMSVKKEKKNERLVRKNKIIFEKDSNNISSEKNSSDRPDKFSHASKKLLSLSFKKSAAKPEEYNAMSKTVKDLLKKYEKLSEKLKELEKKDRKLERKNKLLEKNLKNLKIHTKKGSIINLDKKSQYNNIAAHKTKKDKYSFKKMPSFFHDPLGVKKKREAFELRIYALNDRAKELGELEDQLLKERKIHDKRIAEFTAWKEKLLSLESEIEKRRGDIVELEDALRENLSSSPASGDDLDVVSSETEGELPDETVLQEDYHEILDKIPQSAAIIQRSILRQINSSFAELIGFDPDEIVDKSLFDFIAPEGLADIEKYYLGRLKGSGSSTYETVFSTKGDSKIQVEVSVKPTKYNGEKAEIAVIAKMDNQQGDEDVSIKGPEDKQEETSTLSEIEEIPEDTTIEQTEDVQGCLTGEEEKTQDTTTEKGDDKPDNAASGEAKKSEKK